MPVMSSTDSAYTGTREYGTDGRSGSTSSRVRPSFQAKTSTRGVMTSHVVISSRRKARSTRRFSSSSRTPSSFPISWSSRSSRSSALSPPFEIPEPSRRAKGAARTSITRDRPRSIGADARAMRRGWRAASPRGTASATTNTTRPASAMTAGVATMPQAMVPEDAAMPMATRARIEDRSRNPVRIEPGRLRSRIRASAPENPSSPSVRRRDAPTWNTA